MKRSDFVRLLFVVIVVPVVLHILLGATHPFFNLGTEVSLGMLVSVLLWVGIAGAFATIARQQQDWLPGILAVVFAFLALDDAFAIHEWLAEHMIGPWAVGIVSDEYRYAWLVVYVPAAVAVAVVFGSVASRYLRQAPAAFLAAGAGIALALFLELAEAKQWLGWPDLWRSGLEETVELATVALLLYGLLRNLPLFASQRMIKVKK